MQESVCCNAVGQRVNIAEVSTVPGTNDDLFDTARGHDRTIAI